MLEKRMMKTKQWDRTAAMANRARREVRKRRLLFERRFIFGEIF